jgi:hypothetical protein
VSIEIEAEEVRALGRSLDGRAGTADEIRARLVDDGTVEGPLRTAVGLFLDCQVLLATALAGELRWLGAAVTDVAASWEELDSGLLPLAGRTPGR